MSETCPMCGSPMRAVHEYVYGYVTERHAEGGPECRLRKRVAELEAVVKRLADDDLAEHYCTTCRHRLDAIAEYRHAVQKATLNGRGHVK